MGRDEMTERERLRELLDDHAALAANQETRCTCSDDYGPVAPYCGPCVAAHHALHALNDALTPSAAFELLAAIERLEAARNEACDIAEAAIHPGKGAIARPRIQELRGVK